MRNISKIFKAIFDSGKKIKIVCSGSSSLEIHRHLKESLAGRRFLYRVFPLEYTEIKNGYPAFRFEDYLRFGGMPGLTHTDSAERKQQILNEILGSGVLLKKSCKTYLYDLGVRNMLLKDFSPVDFRPDKGIILEMFVFLKLRTMLSPNMDIPPGLKRFLNRYPCVKSAYIINEQMEKDTAYNGRRIHFLTFEKFSTDFQVE